MHPDRRPRQHSGLVAQLVEEQSFEGKLETVCCNLMENHHAKTSQHKHRHLKLEYTVTKK